MGTVFEIKIEKSKQGRIGEVDFSNLGFGNYVTDHMFVCEYKKGSWNTTQILPFGKFLIAPNALAFHYGQTVFEGMKAFRMNDGNISIFRMEQHFNRLNTSLKRMCMPEISYRLFSESIIQLIRTDSAWLKNIQGTSLYIRPFVIATEERFGVKISDEYKYFVFAGAVDNYYSNPLKVKIEEKYIRAAKGGTGFAKCGGNYGASFYPTKLAKLQGFDQVLWTDGSEEHNIEESGTMNVMFVFDDIVVTPALSDSILGGVTRDSILKLAKGLGYKTEERNIGMKELKEKFKQGKIREAFGTGTAAITAAISTINISGTDYQLPGYNENSFHRKVKKLLSDIRLGIEADRYNWNTILTE
jgi:branched-chain amino acid aminotransferase